MRPTGPGGCNSEGSSPYNSPGHTEDADTSRTDRSAKRAATSDSTVAHRRAGGHHAPVFGSVPFLERGFVMRNYTLVAAVLLLSGATVMATDYFMEGGDPGRTGW